MLKELERPFEKYQTAKHKLVDSLSRFSPDQLSYKLNAETWSILEVVEHLLLVEEVSIRGLNKRLEEKSTIKPAGFSTSVRSFLLNTALKLRIKYKAPSKRVQPSENHSFEELKHRWEHSGNNLGFFISEFNSADLNLPVYRHPRSGDITLANALEFFYEHLAHHLLQIERIKKSEGFPK